jgi:hypothetical protein
MVVCLLPHLLQAGEYRNSFAFFVVDPDSIQMRWLGSGFNLKVRYWIRILLEVKAGIPEHPPPPKKKGLGKPRR